MDGVNCCRVLFSDKEPWLDVDGAGDVEHVEVVDDRVGVGDGDATESDGVVVVVVEAAAADPFSFSSHFLNDSTDSTCLFTALSHLTHARNDLSLV